MNPKKPNEKAPRKDTERETREAIIKDADKTNEADWDRIHGDGDTIGLKDKPSHEDGGSS